MGELGVVNQGKFCKFAPVEVLTSETAVGELDVLLYIIRLQSFLGCYSVKVARTLEASGAYMSIDWYPFNRVLFEESFLSEAGFDDLWDAVSTL